MASVKKKPIKVAVMLLFIAAAAVFTFLQYRKGQLIRQENRAVAHYNTAHYDEAIGVYVDLLPKLRAAGAKDRVRKQLAQCWKDKGDDPKLSFEEQLEYYRKALEYDRGCITNKVLLRALEQNE